MIGFTESNSTSKALIHVERQDERGSSGMSAAPAEENCTPGGDGTGRGQFSTNLLQPTAECAISVRVSSESNLLIGRAVYPEMQ